MKTTNSMRNLARKRRMAFIARAFMSFVVVIFSLAAPCSTLAESYSITVIGDQSYVLNALNNSGQVTGGLPVGNCKIHWKWCRSCDPRYGCFRYPCANSSGHCESHAFVWTPNAINGISGNLLDLGSLKGGDRICYASGVNERGDVVGRSEGNGFLYTGGRMTDLGLVNPMSINAAGAIVGEGADGYAFLWQSGTLTNLGALPQGYRSRATAINDLVQIVGSSSALTDTVSHAVLWQSGAIMDLGTIPGYTHSEALALSTNGQIVGSCYNYPGNSRACLFTIDALGNVKSRASLGTLPGFTNSTARSINNNGQVVGDCWNENDDPPGRAFLWDRSYGMRDLTRMVPEVSIGGAYVINDAGQIVASVGLLSPVLPARLSLPSRETNGQFRFMLAGQAGRSYTIQASTNLANWTALTNVVSTTGTNQFTDPTAPNVSRRFYRAVTP